MFARRGLRNQFLDYYDQFPFPALISMAGMSSDHTEAASITPEAKPSSDFRKRGDMSFFIKKTNDAPNIVPNNGINNPTVIPMTIYLFAKVQKSRSPKATA